MKRLVVCLSVSLLLFAAMTAQAEILAVELNGITEADNALGIAPRTDFTVEFMLDTDLQRNPSRDNLFIDPWDWHWIVGDPWDWLFGFTVDIQIEGGVDPISGNPADLMIIEAVFDDDTKDMVMGLGLGSKFVTTLGFVGKNLNPDRLPGASFFPCQFGDLTIFAETGEEVFSAPILGGMATAVEAKGKLATSWGKIKSRY